MNRVVSSSRPPQSPLSPTSAVFTERERRTWITSSSWLLAYFFFNLALTIYNKLVLAGNFPFPYTLTAIHALSGTIGSWICLRRGVYTMATLTLRENLHIVLFSGLYTINIIVSNVSLHLVTVPFHQIIRSTTPLFVIAMSVIFLGKSYSSQTYLSLIPVIVGVGIATAGDYYFTTMGFILTLVGTLLAGIKTILTNQIQKNTSTPLHPLDLLLRMSPLACLQSFIYAAILDEPRRSYTLLGSISPLARNTLIVKLTINGALAFGLNYVSFAANKKTSPLTMTVAANIKQCLSIILGVWVFRLRVGWMNALGIIIALMGGAWYARIELGSKKRRRAVDTLGIKVNEKEVV